MQSAEFSAYSPLGKSDLLPAKVSEPGVMKAMQSSCPKVSGVMGHLQHDGSAVSRLSSI